MSNQFSGFSRQMPTFFRALEKNNDRAWFTPRKSLFEEQVRAPMLALVTVLNERMRRLSPDHVADDPQRLIYRLYRDTRFSKDKTPYKAHIGATFRHRTLPRHAGAGFYFEVSHKYVGIAGGVYMPGPEELLAIRTAIAMEPKQFLAIVGDRRIGKLFGALQGERLARLPKAWQEHADSPIADYLKYKQFYWWVELPAKVALGPDLPAALLRHFEALVEGLGWFNRVLVAAQRKEEQDPSALRPAPMW